MKRFLNLLKFIFPKYISGVILNMIFNLLHIAFSLFSFIQVIPFLGILFKTQPIVDEPIPFALDFSTLEHNFNYFISNIIKESGEVKALLYVSLFTVIAVLLKTLFLYLSKYFIIPVRNGSVRDIRNTLYGKILSLPLAYFSEERKGDIISRMTSDVQEIEGSIIRSIQVLFNEPFKVMAYFGYLLYASPRLTLIVLVVLPVTGLLIGSIGKSLRRKSAVAQSKLGHILTLIEETLSGLRIIKAFGAESSSQNKFDGDNESYTKVMNSMWRRRDMAVPLSEFLGTLAMVIVLWMGANMVLDSENAFTSQELIGYLLIFSQIIAPAKSFTSSYYDVQKGLASVDRINVILYAENNIVEKENAKPLSLFKESIEYKNTWFKYGKEDILKGINIEIKKGQTVAFVGQSGSGKSTLVDLLPRFYDIYKGSILIDGIDIRDFKIADLRGQIGVVNQESILFNDTIFNNISFGVKDSTMEKVVEAATIANAHSFILEAPNGYESNVGDRGSKLSGGQRQRISIARAILANPPILILDEATSALDTESEQLVQESLNHLMKNRTSIVIAHRLSTIVHADLICVLHQGEIVEQGTHEELLTQDSYYKKLHEAQSFV